MKKNHMIKKICSCLLCLSLIAGSCLSLAPAAFADTDITLDDKAKASPSDYEEPEEKPDEEPSGQEENQADKAKTDNANADDADAEKADTVAKEADLLGTPGNASSYKLEFKPNKSTSGNLWHIASGIKIKVSEILSYFVSRFNRVTGAEVILSTDSAGLSVESSGDEYYLKSGDTITGEHQLQINYQNASEVAESTMVQIDYTVPTEQCVYVHYFPENGSIATYEKVTIPQGETSVTVTRPENDPTKTGFIFTGWYYYDSKRLPHKFCFAGETNPTEISEDISLHARWICKEPKTYKTLRHGTTWLIGSPVSETQVTYILLTNDPDDKPEGAHWNASTDTDYNITGYCVVLAQDKVVLYTEADRIKVDGSLADLFRGFTNLTSIEGLELLETTGSTDFSCMFAGDEKLTSLDLSSFNLSSAQNLNYMFYGCKALGSIDLPKNSETPNLTSMRSMFYGCEKLASLDLTGLNTSGVTTMRNMFFECYKLSNITLTAMCTDSVTDMAGMFCACKALDSLDLSEWNTSKVTDMSYMFSEVGAEGLDLSGWDTSSVTNMSCMFLDASVKLLDLTGFDTSKVTDASFMFYHCKDLQTIATNKDFDTSAMKSYVNIFAGCKNLTGGSGTKYSDLHAGKVFTRLDRSNKPGYFTLPVSVSDIP